MLKYLYIATEVTAAPSTPDATQGVAVTANISVPLVLIQLFATVIMIVLLAKFAWKPYKEYIAKRNSYINENISEAENKKNQAEGIYNQKNQELDEFKQEKSKMLNFAKADANNQKTEIIANAKKQAILVEQKSLETIEKEKEKAEVDLQKDVLTLVNEISQKFVSKTISDEEEMDLYMQAINKVGTDE